MQVSLSVVKLAKVHELCRKFVWFSKNISTTSSSFTIQERRKRFRIMGHCVKVSMPVCHSHNNTFPDPIINSLNRCESVTKFESVNSHVIPLIQGGGRWYTVISKQFNNRFLLHSLEDSLPEKVFTVQNTRFFFFFFISGGAEDVLESTGRIHGYFSSSFADITVNC